VRISNPIRDGLMCVRTIGPKHTNGSASIPSDFRVSGRRVEFVPLSRRDRDLRAKFAQYLGHLQTQASRSAGDERHSPCQVLQLDQIHHCLPVGGAAIAVAGAHVFRSGPAALVRYFGCSSF
jgi:hypothetical protein